MIRVDGRTIILTQANTAALRFNIRDLDRNLVDLDGYIVTFMVKKSKKDPDSAAVITKVLTDVDENVIFTLLPNETNIPVATYWWGLQVKRDLYVNQCASGPFYITDGVIDEW